MERQRLAAEHGRWTSGRAFARDLTAAVDRAVLALLPPWATPAGWALVAVGGYARRDLSPHSDVDLLMLCRRHDPAVERLANTVFYALWDAGLEVLPAVRTVAEARRLAAEDLATRTACLQTRRLAGDEALHAAFQQAILADARQKGGRPFLEALQAENRRRHARAAEAAHGLEPELKEGRGGLRDAQALIWAGSVVLAAAATLEDLARLGYLDADEAAAIEDGVDFLMRIRHHLHYLAGRRSDRLHFEYQEDVAAFLGYQATNGQLPVERLMRDLSARSETLARATAGFWEHVAERLLEKPTALSPVFSVAAAVRPQGRAEPPPVFVARGGCLHLAEGARPPVEGDAALALFAGAAHRGLLVSHGLIRALRVALASKSGAPDRASAPQRWSPAARESFLAVLRAGENAPPLLEALAECGLLASYLPEWEGVRYLYRQDLCHLYTVDRHSLLTVAELHRVAAGQGGDGDLGASLAADVADFDVLLLAGLLHDLGKGLPGDHSEVGAELAATIAERMGLSAQAATTLSFLVRHHLLLARTAGRRDLDDATLIARLAELVGDPERLRMLYLLTVADSFATGPSAWSDWKASLLRDLFFRLLHALDGGFLPGLAERLAARRRELRTALFDLDTQEAIDVFLDRMPASYLLSQNAAAVCEHYVLLGQAEAGAPRVAVQRSPNGQYEELTLAAADRPGLLWRVCGVFALHGVNILEARVYTDASGKALDVFRLADAFESEVSAEKRKGIVRDLGLALEGRLSLAYRLARKLTHYRPHRTLPARAVRVAVDNAASEDYTVIEIHAPDRLGLLYTITRALNDLHLDIHLAKVTTRGPEAVDVFYVHDYRGGKVDDPAHAREIEQAVRFELEEASPGA